jgi:hypothetical protein
MRCLDLGCGVRTPVLDTPASITPSLRLRFPTLHDSPLNRPAVSRRFSSSACKPIADQVKIYSVGARSCQGMEGMHNLL